MKNSIRNILAAFVFFFTLNAHAALSPAAVSIVPGVQFPPSDYSVTGLRLSMLYGRHRDVYGLDLGVLGNVTDQAFTGLAISGLFNVTNGTTKAIGLQLAGLTNINTNKTSVYGLQAALGANINYASSTVVGFQVAAANIAAHTDIYGVQIGVYNRALNVTGLQIGLVNVAQSLRGLQIGLMNFNYTGLFYVAPILNVGF